MMRKTKLSAQMKKMSLECEAVDCNFITPTLEVKEYDAMVRHLQLHTKLVHGVEVAGEGCDCQKKVKVGAGKTLPPSSEKQRSKTRSRSRRRSNVEELDFPCPDCNLQSFATEAGLYMHRRRVCGLRGVKPTGFDFPCQEKGCGRVFSSPMGVAQHRVSCKKLPENLHGQNNASEEERGRGREKKRDRGKRSRSEKTTSSWSRERRAALVQRSITSTNGRSFGGVEVSPSNRQRRDKRTLSKEVRNPDDLGGALGDSGATTTRRSSERGVAPVQRPVTPDEVASSSSRRDVDDQRREDLKVEMEVTMTLRNGKVAVTKYRVSGQAVMQSVIQKTANKMEREAKEVKLYKRDNFGRDLEVSGATLAVNYGGSSLAAEVVRVV